jgi:hypothetical protein
MNPLLKLASHGQSYWMDDLSREMLDGGSPEGLRLAVDTEPRSGTKDELLELCGTSRRHIEAAVSELVTLAA